MDVYVLLADDGGYDTEYVVAVECTRAEAEAKAKGSGRTHALEHWTLGKARVGRWVKRGERGDWVEDVLL